MTYDEIGLYKGSKAGAHMNKNDQDGPLFIPQSFEQFNEAYYKKYILPQAYMRGENPRKKDAKSKQRVISPLLFYGFLFLLVIGAFIFSQGNKKPIFGYSIMNVLSQSMQSEIPRGSLILIKQTDPYKIKIGDDITYMKDENTMITHRVIRIVENLSTDTGRGFETKGIENDTPDFEIVPSAAVVGVVKLHIPAVGGLLDKLGENIYVTIAFAVGFLLFFILLRGAFARK